jgi:hypothetical protein
VNRFHLPYNFIPATGSLNGLPSDDICAADVRGGDSVCHDVFRNGELSGTLLYTIEFETEGGVGKARVGNEHPKKLKLYTRCGVPAIPASSLLGLISSTAETLSQSALRVLCRKERHIGKEREVGGKLVTGRSIGSLWDCVKPELRPYNERRCALTPAELMFGFVSDDLHKVLPAFASRIRFSDARAIGEIKRDAEVVLQILATPHAKYPPFYYKSGTGHSSGLLKDTLALSAVDARGRKYYLHQRKRFVELKKYVEHPKRNTKDDEQRTKVLLWATGSKFSGHIDFEGLYPEELGLLLRALHPSAGFRHRLGIGKPFGLGRVRIEVIGLKAEDRSQRKSPFDSTGKSSMRFLKTSAPILADASRRFRDIRCALEGASQLDVNKLITDFSEELVDSETLKLLNLIGNPSGFDDGKLPTVYPRNQVQLNQWLTGSDAKANEELYEWFRANNGIDGAASRHLQGLPWCDFKDLALPTNPKNMGRRDENLPSGDK